MLVKCYRCIRLVLSGVIRTYVTVKISLHFVYSQQMLPLTAFLFLSSSSCVSPFFLLSNMGLLSSVPWGFLNVWLRIRTILISLKLMKTSSLKNACFGKMATVLTILIRRKNLTHGWYSHMMYFTMHSVKNHAGQFDLGKKQSQNLIVFFGTPCISKHKYSNH